ncbi:MAG: IPT/TIG domain-containing protein [Actinomycetota bacterium]|nr:IPT/TIG domain-containing protein [Actinomycetota bacterium]
MAGGHRRHWCGVLRRVARRAGAALLATALVAPLLTALPAGAAPGDLDPGFGAGGTISGPAGDAAALAVQPDQKILVGGSRPAVRFGPRDAVLARYNREGSLDTSFGGGDGVAAIDLGTPDTRTTGESEFIEDVAVLPNKRIVVVGSVGFSDLLLARFEPNGDLDPTFGDGGIVVTDIAGESQSAVAVVLQDDKVVVGAQTSSAATGSGDFLLARYTAAGALDTSFGGGDGLLTTNFVVTPPLPPVPPEPPVDPPDSSDILADLVLDGDAIVAAGSTFDPGTFEESFALGRYDANGAPDTGFGPRGDGTLTTSIGIGAGAQALTLQGGKVVAAGQSVSPSGSVNFTLARYEDDGSLDTGFDGDGKQVTRVGRTSVATAATVDDAGNLLVAGNTTNDPDDSDSDFALVRYDASGQPDTAFSDDGIVVTDFGTNVDSAAGVEVQQGRPLVAGIEERGFALARYQVADVGADPGVADLAVAVAAPPDAVTAGQELAVTVTITNLGPGNAYDVGLSGPDPAGALVLSAQSSQGFCTIATRPFTCTLHSLSPGTSARATLFLLPTAEGFLAPAAEVTSRADPSPANDRASATLAVNRGTGRWDAVAPFLFESRTRHTATLLPTGKVLVAGGLALDDQVRDSADLFDPATGTWSPTAPMDAARADHSATLLRNGKVLVAGGAVGPDGDGPLTSAELYDPATGTWAPVAVPMNVARARHTATALDDGRVLVVGGFVNPFEAGCPLEVPLAAEVFDPVAGTWSPTGPRRFATVEHTADQLPSGEVLVVGGNRGSVYQFPSQCPDDPVGQLGQTELFDPVGGAWRPAAAPEVQRGGHSATALADDRVLVAGGTPCGSGDCIVAAVEAYDPAGGAWSAAPSMGTARAFASAVPMPGGEVLVAGGLTPSDVELERGISLDVPVTASAEVYDPEQNQWTSGGAMAVPRQRATATVLPLGPTSLCGERCGRVLVAGGEDNAPEALRSAEVYTPVPEVTAISPPSGPPAGNVAVTVTGTGFSGATTVRFGAVPAVSYTVESSTRLTAVAPPQAVGTVPVTVATPGGISPITGASEFTYAASAPVAPVEGPGYRLVASDGGVFAFGAPFVGSTGGLRLNQAVVGMAAMPRGRAGYWLVASDGGVFAFGDAPFRGSTGALRLNRPVVGMAPTPSGNGYWLVASDGGVFAFGDARFHGSTGGLRLNRPVVGMAPTPSGNGYWLVASDGGVFAFGDAAFRGSTGALRLSQPVVGVAPTRSGNGYWLVASDGGVFAFGDAPFRGSTGALRLNRPVVGIAAFNP